MAVNDNTVKISILLDNGKYMEGMAQIQGENKKLGQSSNAVGESFKNMGKQGSAAAQSMTQNWMAITAKVMAAYASIRFIINAFRDVTKAAIESREAQASIAAALKAQGRNVDVMLPQYRALASQMQDIAGVSDEVALNAEKELVLRGKTYNEIKKAMPLWANMVASGMGAEEALRIVEQVMGGMPTMLERTNGKLRQMREAGASVEEIMAELTEDYAGQAELITDAKMGIDQLKERWGDVKEAIGEVNTGPLADMIKMLNEALITIQRLIRASSGFNVNTMSLEEIQDMRDLLGNIRNRAYSNLRETSHVNAVQTYADLSNREEGMYFITEAQKVYLEGMFGNLEEYLEKKRSLIATGWQIDTGKLIEILDARRDAVNTELESERERLNQSTGDQPDGTTGETTTGQTTQYLSDWEKINVLVSTHQIDLAAAAERMSDILLSETARREELMKIAASQKPMTDEQAKELSLLQRHVEEYEKIDAQLAANGEQTAYQWEQLHKTSQELEKQESLAGALASAFGGSMGGSIGNIAKSFGQIGDASKVMNAGVSGGKVSAEAMSGATASAAAAWIAIADEVSKIAKQIYDIGTSTGDWGEAFETAILDTLSQIPVIGSWIAEIVDNLWKTGTENLEELQAQEAALEAAGQSTVANKQAQIEILKDQLSKVTDITKQYELQADILNLQNDIVDEITGKFQRLAGVYETAANIHLDIGEYSAGISELTSQILKLMSEATYLQNLNATTGLTTEQWQEYWSVVGQVLEVSEQIEDAKQRQYDDELNILEAQKAYLEASGGDVVDNINAQIVALEAKLALESDVAEQYDIQTQILELQNELTKEQNKLLDEQIDKIKGLAGYLDVENVGVQRMLESQLRSTGLTGLDLNEALSGVGVVGANVGESVTNLSSVGTVITNNTYNLNGSIESIDR